MSRQKVAFFLVMAISVYLMAATQAEAQTAQFSSEATAISGSVTKCLLNILPILCTTTAVNPLNPSITPVSGSNDSTAPTASQTVNVVEVYNFLSVNDSTSASDTASSDNATAAAGTGAGSLLGGLISWKGNDNLLACAPDPIYTSTIDCASTETTPGLTIYGVAVTPGTYPAGSSFPVSGVMSDSQCLLGVETFKGNLVVEESSLQGVGTANVSLSLTGLHLTGQATCTVLALINLFTIQYDLKVAATSENITANLANIAVKSTASLDVPIVISATDQP